MQKQQPTAFMKMVAIQRPLIVAPMAGGPSSVALVSEASRAGALGSMGAAYTTPQGITAFAEQVRQQTDRPFAINVFAPHAQPELSATQIEQAILATAPYRHELGLPAPSLTAPYGEDFDRQFEAALRARPAVLSFVFGLLPPDYLRAARAENIITIGTATTPTEAVVLQDAGVDAIVLQGIEAGGHRGIFDANGRDEEMNLFTLLEACVASVDLPLIAAGGIMTAEHIQQALRKGAQAVQMGTAFLACKEASTSAPYKARLLESAVRKTQTTRVFSGRLARGLENRFMREMANNVSPLLPFPAQNQLTRDLRSASAAKGLADFLSLWSGTGVGELWQGPARELIEQLLPD